MAAAAASTHFTLDSTLLGLKAVVNPVITTELPLFPADIMRVNELLLVTKNEVPGTNGLVLCNDVRLLYKGCKVIIIIDTTSTLWENRKTGKYTKSSYAVPFMCTDISPPNITLTTTTKLYKYISNQYEHICDENSQFIENIDTLKNFARQNRLYYKEMDPVIRALKAVNPDSMSKLNTGPRRDEKFPVRPNATTSSGRSFSGLMGLIANFLPEVPQEAAAPPVKYEVSAALPADNIENLPYYYPYMDTTTAENLFKEENKYIIRKSSSSLKPGIYTITFYTQHAINPTKLQGIKNNLPIKHFRIVRHQNGELSLENDDNMFKTVDDVVQYKLRMPNVLFPINGKLPRLTPYKGDNFKNYKNSHGAASAAAVPNASGSPAVGSKSIIDHTLQELLDIQNMHDSNLYNKTRDEVPVIMSQNPTLKFVIRKGSTDKVLVYYKDGKITNTQLPNMGITLRTLFSDDKYKNILADLDTHKFLGVASPSSMIASAANAAEAPQSVQTMPNGMNSTRKGGRSKRSVKHIKRVRKTRHHTKYHTKSRGTRHK